MKKTLLLGSQTQKKSQNKVVRRRILKGQKTRPRHKTLGKPSRNELAMVGKAGGVLSAAYHVVVAIVVVSVVKWSGV